MALKSEEQFLSEYMRKAIELEKLNEQTFLDSDANTMLEAYQHYKQKVVDDLDPIISMNGEHLTSPLYSNQDVS